MKQKELLNDYLKEVNHFKINDYLISQNKNSFLDSKSKAEILKLEKIFKKIYKKTVLFFHLFKFLQYSGFISFLLGFVCAIILIVLTIVDDKAKHTSGLVTIAILMGIFLGIFLICLATWFFMYFFNLSNKQRNKLDYYVKEIMWNFDLSDLSLYPLSIARIFVNNLNQQQYEFIPEQISYLTRKMDNSPFKSQFLKYAAYQIEKTIFLNKYYENHLSSLNP